MAIVGNDRLILKAVAMRMRSGPGVPERQRRHSSRDRLLGLFETALPFRIDTEDIVEFLYNPLWQESGGLFK